MALQKFEKLTGPETEIKDVGEGERSCIHKRKNGLHLSFKASDIKFEFRLIHFHNPDISKNVWHFTFLQSMDACIVIIRIFGQCSVTDNTKK